ncbi:MAG TPA: response regulator [Candidatus Paceibacterota bacterium]
MKKILFIEDEESLQNVVKETLKENGYNVLSALDGKKGIEIAKNEKPDLILLDLILPQKDGFEVLEALKENPNTAVIPVIVLTNLEGSADIEKALSLGARTYLVKSNYSLDDVLLKVKNVFGE